MKIPEETETIITRIDKFYTERKEPPRGQFGLSQIGGKCERALWLSWRKAVKPNFPGRILRLFERGHEEEPRIVRQLQAIGIPVKETGVNQREVSASKFVMSSIDGIIPRGVPDAPKTEHILEIKTSGDKPFKEVVKKGVQASKPLHYVQMQVYMHLSRIHRALYIMVNKNTDELYTERVRYDPAIGKEYVARAIKLSEAERMPDPLSTDPSWYECKWCDCYDFCHKDKLTKEMNCRTCCHSTPDPKKGWTCSRWDNAEIPVDAQMNGCRSHVLHPDLVPWKPLDAVDRWTGAYEINGERVPNGENGYSTKEIFTVLENGGTFNQENVDKIRKIFNGEIVKNGTV